MSRAVCLVSGGLDSAVAAAIARFDRGHEVHMVNITYGQRHRCEVQSAARLAEHWKVPLTRLYFTHPGGSSLLDDSDQEVPLDRDVDKLEGIPTTYVPGRNIIMVALAASLAEKLDAGVIYTGFNAVDYSGYPDCGREFVGAMNAVLTVGTKTKPGIIAPLMLLSKAEVIQIGFNYGVPFEFTWSCYQGGSEPCGRCDSCRIRAKGFRECGRTDPLLKVPT